MSDKPLPAAAKLAIGAAVLALFTLIGVLA